MEEIARGRLGRTRNLRGKALFFGKKREMVLPEEESGKGENTPALLTEKWGRDDPRGRTGKASAKGCERRKIPAHRISATRVRKREPPFGSLLRLAALLHRGAPIVIVVLFFRLRAPFYVVLLGHRRAARSSWRARSRAGVEASSCRNVAPFFEGRPLAAAEKTLTFCR